MPALLPSPGFFPSAHSLVSGDSAAYFFAINDEAVDTGGAGPGGRCVAFTWGCSFTVGHKAHIWIEPDYSEDLYIDPIVCCGAPDANLIDTSPGPPLPGAGVYGTVITSPAIPLTIHWLARRLNNDAPVQSYIIRFGKLWCGASPEWFMHNVTHCAYWP